jgi:hypothetical protein
MAIGFCEEHQRIETDWQRVNELTENYLVDHSEILDRIFSPEPRP